MKVRRLSVAALLLAIGCMLLPSCSSNDNGDDGGVPPVGSGAGVPVSRKPPGGLEPSEIPQFIIMTFDDGIVELVTAPYSSLIAPNTNFPHSADTPVLQRASSGGERACGLMATFYSTVTGSAPGKCTAGTFPKWASKPWLIQALHNAGHHIATHTCTHAGQPTLEDMIGQYTYLHADYGADLPIKKISGFRTPNLDFAQSTFDNLFTIMQSGDYGPIEWDSSISEDNTNPFVPGSAGYGTDHIFPYTLDDGIKQSCSAGGGTCDNKKKLPGLWEYPMTFLYDKENNTIGDGMDPAPQSGQTVQQILKMNFERHYNGNRAPLGIFLHGGQWLPAYGTDLVGFANDVLEHHDDVYFVTVAQFLAWMENPVPASEFKLDCYKGNSCLPPNSPGTPALAGTCGYGKMNLETCKCDCSSGAVPDAYGMCILK